MGLTYTELQELLKYVEDNHSWKNMYDIHCKHKDKKIKIIKYMSFSFDTRECDIWHIKFVNVSGDKANEKEFRTEMGYNLKEEIYKWLNDTEV